MTGHFVPIGTGETVQLGTLSMRVLADRASTGGAFGLVEFRGGGGPWTIPHVHRDMEETFYVLDGAFDFLFGAETLRAEAGSSLVVPRGTAHMMTAAEGGGALLTLFTPAGLEDMFRALGRLPADSLLDPAARADIARHFDSVPVPA